MLSTFTWYFLSTNGRISRQEFRLGYFGLILVDVLIIRTWRNLTIPRVRYYNVPDLNPPLDLAPLLAVLITLWPLVAVLVKRLHDLNVSGWWLLLVLAAPAVADAIHIKIWFPYLLLLAVLGFLPGRSGDNRFGRDPLARAGI
ncbi:DUF805 domain-containing protein [Bradyrhizobium lablabi]|uniref:DUF805 domain-containing protein n=1 Tax=Bradyrhizobium lablabi TaxID=722472 RepID=UPI001BAD6FA5|nr:DUF805 domain-containing protein [Bradyrhizobium lablabi]MBR0693031.1 DUF805 domain-containing protein [Bradyrhizobium lablabi]